MPAARRIYKVKTLASVLTKPRRTRLPQQKFPSVAANSLTRRVQFTISCPHLGTLVNPKTSFTFREYSSTKNPLKGVNSLQQVSKRHSSSNAGCPCPFPCGPCGCKAGCGCLPPPCNTPPKCLQYMTGYYYYPYGTWFCGPYHVSGTCTPVGSGCPCPCPVKCCPACVCAPAQNLSTNKNLSDISQFPVEVPCHAMPKIPQETRGGMAKIFNFNGPDKCSQSKKKPTSVPPSLSSFLCSYPDKRSRLMEKEPRIKSSYPTPGIPKSRFYHTETISISKPPEHTKQRNWKYSYYQTRHKATPMERTRIFLKESKNSPRSKLDSDPNQRRRDPRPEADVEIRPYDDGQ